LSICASTMTYMTAKLPPYFKVYKNLVQHYPMD